MTFSNVFNCIHEKNTYCIHCVIGIIITMVPPFKEDGKQEEQYKYTF